MTTLNKLAQAAYEAMVDRVDAGGQKTGDPFLDGEWDAQLQILKDDWIVSIGAALQELRNHPGAKTKAQRDTWHELIDAILNEEAK